MRNAARLRVKMKMLSLGMMLLLFTVAFGQYETAPRSSPAHSRGAELNYPEHYREWVYLSSGFDMSYSPAGGMDHPMFDNVFVNPQAYRAFMETGTWPDKTMLVLEVRGAEGRGSINQKGNYQGTAVMGLEVHRKDEAQFPGKWAFFAFDKGRSAKMIPTSADCYSCHEAHGAVDTTFVQFYPTLLPIAEQKGTLSASYLKEVKTPSQK
jgi:Cytochrome P460